MSHLLDYDLQAGPVSYNFVSPIVPTRDLRLVDTQ